MAHVHGAAAAAQISKSAAKMAGEGMSEMMKQGMPEMMMGEGMSGMMGKGMTGMMGEGMTGMMGEGMTAMMGEGMGDMMKEGMMGRAAQNVAKGVAATGAVVAARASAGKSIVSKVLRNPWVLFGLGVALGYTVHKYRKEIIDSTNRVAEKGKDFFLQQRENLEDLVAEADETES